jgi:hypothetical protein
VIDAGPTPDGGSSDGGNTDGGNPDSGPATVSFKTQVEVILENKCQGCHSEGPGGFYVIGDTQTDYTAVQGQVNLATPEQSKLYQNPTGQAAHGGGTIFAPSSAEAQTILTWIQQGAKDN